MHSLLCACVYATYSAVGMVTVFTNVSMWYQISCYLIPVAFHVTSLAHIAGQWCLAMTGENAAYRGQLLPVISVLEGGPVAVHT